MGTLAIDLIISQRSIKDPSMKRGNSIKFQIGLAAGPVITACVGNLIPKYCLFGKTVAIVESLATHCPAGRILMSKEFKDKLPANFRYSNASSSVVTDELESQIFFLRGKQDHDKISVAPILKAYSRFKRVKIKDALVENGGLMDSMVDEDEIIKYMNSNPAPMCSASNICHLL